ncbi:unnamed protein product [Phytomonas sp. EM1]|nr:unnamed protein product [Phytomonas sp. EM1]|eukprot:CCW61952.1 unnamed protein product [Phytomonas sp. isolate EM1]
MDTFSAFSTSPSANVAAFHANDGNPGGISPGGGMVGAGGGVSSISHLSNPGATNGILANGNFSKITSTALFTTSANQNALIHSSRASNTNVGSRGTSPINFADSSVNGVGTGSVRVPLGTIHMSSTMDCSPSTDSFGESTLESITQTLSVLQNIAEGRHFGQWNDLLDPKKPVESARKVNAALNKAPLPVRKEGITVLARGMTTPAHLTIVSHMEEPYRNEVRNLVLHDLLNQLSLAGNDPMPLCAEMLAELSRLNLVRLSGVAVAIERYLNEPDKRRAGIALLGRVAEYNRGSEAFCSALQSTNALHQLYTMCKDPEYEYDISTITQLLSSSSDKGPGASLFCHCTIPLSAPVTCMHYFRGRDELVSGQANGTVVMWGGPNPTSANASPPNISIGPLDQRLVSVRHVVTLSPDDIAEHSPVSMAGPQRGNYLVAAGMSYHVMHPYAPYLDTAASQSKRRSISGTPLPQALLRVMPYNEQTGEWGNGDVFLRPFDRVITAVAALSNNTICSAESSLGGNSFLAKSQETRTPKNCTTASSVFSQEHNIQLINSSDGRVVRTLANAHSDYITVLSTCEDDEVVLISGSRDKTIKLWDTRVSNSSAGSNVTNGTSSLSSPSLSAKALSASVYKLESSLHTDTISTIYTFRNFIFTGSMDGSMLIWDSRRTAAPVTSRSFISPILDIAALEGGRTAVATARGLYLISLETMSAVHVVPNLAFTRLLSNDSGSVVFAAGAGGISVFSLRR